MDFHNATGQPGPQRKSDAPANHSIGDGWSQAAATDRASHPYPAPHEPNMGHASFSFRGSPMPISLPPLSESYVPYQGVQGSAGQFRRLPAISRRRVQAPSLNSSRSHTLTSPRSRSGRASSDSTPTEENGHGDGMPHLYARADFAFRDALRSSLQRAERASPTNISTGHAAFSGSTSSTLPPRIAMPRSSGQIRVRRPLQRAPVFAMATHNDDDSDNEFDSWLNRLDAEVASPTEARIAEMDKVVHAALNRVRSEFGSANVEDPEREAIEKPLGKCRAKATEPLLAFQQGPAIQDSPDCQMCLETYGETTPEGVSEVALKLPCNHVFGNHCMQKWLSEARHMECPYCRTRLVPSLKVHGPSVVTTWLQNMLLYLREIQAVRRKLMNRRDEAEERASQRLVEAAIRARRARLASLDANQSEQGRPSSRRRINASGQAAGIQRDDRPARLGATSGGSESPSSTGGGDLGTQLQSSPTSQRGPGHTIRPGYSFLHGTGWSPSVGSWNGNAGDAAHTLAPMAQESATGRGTLPNGGYPGAYDHASASGSAMAINAAAHHQVPAPSPHASSFHTVGASYDSFVGREPVLGAGPLAEQGWRLHPGTTQEYYYAVQALNETFHYNNAGVPRHDPGNGPRRTGGEDLVNPSA